MSELSWGLFLALAVSAIFVALEAPMGPVIILILIIAFLFAFRYPYATFYAAILLVPFLGFTVSIPAGEFALGRRAFGGSVDMAVAEAILLTLLAAWGLKIVLLWIKRRDLNWKPRLPLAWSYASLVGAHIVSAFSSLQPDPVLTAKYAMRPVLFCYLAFVAMPVNFIRSRRRLVATLGCVSAVGIFAAMNGAISLLFVDATSQFIRRAHPLPLFGIPALGDNHNLLAELMAVTVLTTYALAQIVKKQKTKELLTAASVFQLAIGLLTFSRTVWIVFILQAVVLGMVEYREVLRRHLSSIFAALLLILPLVGVMLQIGASDVASSSNSTRLALAEIAYQVFLTSPIIGSGAGTFVDRVGSAQVFLIEYGEPLDSHGVLQKLAAETGVVGLAAFAFVLGNFGWLVWKGLQRMPAGSARRAVFLLATSAAGAVVYQVFNTNYWTGKMWLPVGLTLAALQVFSRNASSESSEPI